MADATMIILTTFASIVGGGVTGYITARIKARDALEEWKRSRHAMVRESAVTLLKETVTDIAGAGHANCWLTWKAECDPKSLELEDVESYDQTMHALMPKILGGQAAIATFCPKTASEVLCAIEGIRIEAEEVDRACIAYRAGDPAPLAARHKAANEAYAKARELCEGLGANLLAGSHAA